MKKTIIIGIGIFGLMLHLQSTQLIAQTRTITGIVYNGIINKPLANLTIEVKGADKKTTTTSTGEYSLQIPDTMKIVTFTDFAGMDVMEIKYINEDEINIYLSEVNIPDFSIEQLMNIKVVTASKQEQQISDIPASVEVITRADIEAYGYHSLSEILSNALGMYKIDDYRNVSFGVRGFFSNVYNRNIIFMINGVIQQHPYLNFNDLNLMNLQVESIERIEVVQGPTAIIYGNDAFFGVINIITNQKGKKQKSSATTSYGTNNTYRGNAQINSSKENTDMSFSVGYYQTDGHNVPFNNILDSVQRFDNTWIKNGTTKDFFKQKGNYFNVNIDHNGFYINASYDETERNLINIFAPIYESKKLTRNEHIFRAKCGYRLKINPKITVDINSSLENYLSNSSYDSARVIPSIPFGRAIIQDKKNRSEITAFIKPINKMQITMGANYYYTPNAYQEVDIPAIGINRNFEMLNTACVEYAFYSQLQYSLLKSVHFVGGIRADKQNPYEYKNIKYVNNIYKDTVYTYSYKRTSITPSIAIIYNINSKNILKLIYNKAVSRPGVYENSFTIWKTHPLLQPQNITSTEINYLTIPKNKITCSFSLFYNKLDNLINRQVTYDAKGNVLIVNNNSGKMETFGGELQIIYKPINDLKFDASFSYQKTTNELLKIDAAYSPKVLANLKASYTIHKNIILAFCSYYVGRMESDWNEITKARISPASPAYFNLATNLRINNIFKSGLYFSVHGDNLLNTDIYYPPTSVNSSYLPNGTYDTGIQLFATLGLKF
jgi:outer membrane cobalamin receptor